MVTPPAASPSRAPDRGSRRSNVGPPSRRLCGSGGQGGGPAPSGQGSPRARKAPPASRWAGRRLGVVAGAGAQWIGTPVSVADDTFVGTSACRSRRTQCRGIDEAVYVMLISSAEGPLCMAGILALIPRRRCSPPRSLYPVYLFQRPSLFNAVLVNGVEKLIAGMLGHFCLARPGNLDEGASRCAVCRLCLFRSCGR